MIFIAPKYGAIFMKQKLFISIIIAAILLIIAITMFRPHNVSVEKRIMMEEIDSLLIDGDIICRLGNRIWSSYFCNLSPVDKRYSHLGIIRRINNKITVIHAEAGSSDGKSMVKETGLQDFLNIAKSIGIYRFNNIRRNDISDEAVKLVNRPFDWNFDSNEEESVYCTELLFIIINHLSFNIDLSTIYLENLNREIIPLDSCYDSRYFSEILYIKRQ
jgi:hypothetical protein